MLQNVVKKGDNLQSISCLCWGERGKTLHRDDVIPHLPPGKRKFLDCRDN
jgi:hypothetical protein